MFDGALYEAAYGDEGTTFDGDAYEGNYSGTNVIDITYGARDKLELPPLQVETWTLYVRVA